MAFLKLTGCAHIQYNRIGSGFQLFGKSRRREGCIFLPLPGGAASQKTEERNQGWQKISFAVHRVFFCVEHRELFENRLRMF
jgi:hypothetical protein